MLEMDYAKLLGRAKEYGLTQKALAEEIGVSESHFCRKLAGEYSFRQSEIRSICKVLRIDAGEIGTYFFTPNG